MNLKIGDLILVKGKGLISEAIEYEEHSYYSHVAIYVGNGQLIEAEGFRKTGYASIDKYKGMADIYRYDDLTNRQRLKIIEYLEGQVGGHYDYLLLFLEFFRCKLHIKLLYKERYYCHICSMLAYDAYKKASVNLWPNINFPSPADIPKPLRKIGSL